MTRYTVSPTIKLRNQILATVCSVVVEWCYGATLDVSAIHNTIDHLIDEAFAGEARRRETRRRKQLAELLRSKR